MSGTRWLALRYYLYQTTLSLGFYVPVSVVYLRDLGFSLAFVGLTWTVFSLSLLLAEVPTGYLGDRVGRRWTLVFGNGCRVVGIGGYAFAETAPAFLALKVFTGVGWALRSGTGDAYLYELLGRYASDDRFATIKGRGKAVQLTTSAGTALAGGALYAVEPVLPFVATGLLAAGGIPVLLGFPSLDDGDDGEPFTVGDAVTTLRRQVGRPDVRWVVAYTGLVLLAFDLTRTFEQPALRSLGFEATRLGVLYAGFKLVSALGGALVDPLRDRLGIGPVLLLTAPVVGVAYGSLLVAPVLLLPVAFLYRFVHTLLVPLRNQYLNDRLGDAGRATVLSGVSMALSLGAVLVRLAGSVAVEVVGTVDLLGLAGVGFGATAVLVWIAAAGGRERIAAVRDAV